MLELQKYVLNAVADNNDLFKKELKKSLVWLNANELKQLSKWVKENFGDSHKDVIEETISIQNSYA